MNVIEISHSYILVILYGLDLNSGLNGNNVVTIANTAVYAMIDDNNIRYIIGNNYRNIRQGIIASMIMAMAIAGYFR